MRRLAAVVLLAAAVAAPLSACHPPEAAAPRGATASTVLPLRALRLYETGVGYFERSGAVSGGALTTLPVPAGHLDDALKTLVVLDGGSGDRVAGVAFSSSVSRAMARSRAGLPSDPDKTVAFRDLLVSMKGERVTLQTRRGPFQDGFTGRIIEVGEEIDEDARAALAAGTEKQDAPSPAPKRLTVTLLGDRGEVTLVDARDIVRARPVDAAFAARLDAALDALSTRSAQNARPLRLLGGARGNVTFGYVAETPVWRATYRLVLGEPGAGAAFQGWALVHNDTDEPWRGVHLELVNGEPDSFLYPLAAPRYARRELVHPDEPLSTMPQLHGTTADVLWGDHLDAETHGSGSGTGYGYGHGTLGGSHRAHAPLIRMGSAAVSGPTTGSSSVLGVGNLAALSPANGAENGALFVYAIPAPFSLDAHESALVPFVDRRLEAEPVAWLSAVGESARSAIRFVNATGQTLPGGTVSVFAAGGFAGETSLDRLKPGERRFLQIGNDLDTEATRKQSRVGEESKRLTFDDGRLQEHFLRTTEETWEVENRSGSARTMMVRLRADSNARIDGVDRVDFDEASDRPVVVFTLPPRHRATRSFTVVEGLSRATRVDDLGEKALRDLLTRTTIPPRELAVVGAALDAVRALEAEHAKVGAAEHDESVAKAELERLREHLKALGGDKGGAGAPAAPLVKRVVDAEERLEGARRRREAAEKALGPRREAVTTTLRRLGSS